MVTWLRAQDPAECNCPSHGLLWVQLQCRSYMLPKVDTNLQQLAILTNVSHFETLVKLDYCALAADLHSWTVATFVSQAVCGKAWEFLCMMSWIAAGRSGIQIINEDQEGKAKIIILNASTYVHRNKSNDMFYVSCSIANVWDIWNWNIQQGNYRWSSLVLRQRDSDVSTMGGVVWPRPRSAMTVPGSKFEIHRCGRLYVALPKIGSLWCLALYSFWLCWVSQQKVGIHRWHLVIHMCALHCKKKQWLLKNWLHVARFTVARHYQLSWM